MEIKMMESRVLGDYILLKELGQGSFGAVFLAEHRYMKRQYIVKILPPELAKERSFIQRFEEDVMQLSTLDHPNIVKIHNISFSQGQYFLVTDCVVDQFLETTNLGTYLNGAEKLSEETIFYILSQIAAGLDYAHQKKTAGAQLIHGTLKLNNILIGKNRTAGPDVLISDFGLSKIVGAGASLLRSFKYVAENLGATSLLGKGEGSYENQLTEPQKLLPLQTSFLQNFSFLAPEQKRKLQQASFTGKVDVYAFGILAYYLLMNEYPEGFLEMPSKRFPEYEKNWDLLIQQTLQKDPLNRVELLLPLLEEIAKSKEIKVEIPQIIEREDPNVKEELPSLLFAENLEEEKKEDLSFHKLATEMTASLKILPEKNGVSTVVAGSNQTVLREHQQVLKPVIHRTELIRPETDPDPASAFIIDTTVKHYTPEHKEIKNIQPLRTEMIIIPGGDFLRGSNDGNRDETPRHQVKLSSFAIDIHPVTNEQFVRFLEVMGGEKDNNHQDVIRLRDSRIKRSGGKLSIESGYAKHPVVGVTWYGSMAYAKWVGMRLPTEAEWEIAAYGGLESSFYPTGEDIEKSQANFFSSDTTAVMSYPPNEYGLFDMPGNVYEWCYDWYGYNYYEVSIQEPENPMGPLQGVYRVLRGGCWKSLKEDLRCSRRHRNNPGTVNGTYGFRCVTDVQ